MELLLSKLGIRVPHRIGVGSLGTFVRFNLAFLSTAVIGTTARLPDARGGKRAPFATMDVWPSYRPGAASRTGWGRGWLAASRP